MVHTPPFAVNTHFRGGERDGKEGLRYTKKNITDIELKLIISFSKSYIVCILACFSDRGIGECCDIFRWQRDGTVVFMADNELCSKEPIFSHGVGGKAVSQASKIVIFHISHHIQEVVLYLKPSWLNDEHIRSNTQV